MVALRLFALLLAASLALPAHADVFPYETVVQTGRNNIIDSNAISCDTTGTPAAPGEGCYTRTGTRCSANPGQMCDLQIVPAGRCTTGNLALGNASCVWPHNAGRCASNTRVGCLSDTYLASPIAANAVSGPSRMCSGLASNSCDMTADKFGKALTATDIVNCNCQGTNAAGAGFETTVCGSGPPVCSDGDPDRDVGGYGTALGVEILTGAPGQQTFAVMGPSSTGSSTPSSTPYYISENPPSVFDPQRDPGTVGRTNAGPIHNARTTDAREITSFLPALGVRKINVYGDAYWNDWFFSTVQTTGTFNSHIITWSCDPPVGWTTDTALTVGPNPGNKPDGTPDTGDQFPPFDPASRWCSNPATTTHPLGARDGVSFLWDRDLTPTELAANPTCPPNCRKDFDTNTLEIEAYAAAGALDADAGAQLAIQAGEGRQAGAGDAIGTAVVTSITWLIDGDLRCKVGGWGSTPIGRCSDGPNQCDPTPSGTGTLGDAGCAAAGQGGSCRACNGPLDLSNTNTQNGRPNSLGLPPGYNTHGLPELDLVATQRVGGIAGQAGDIRVPLFVTGTTGRAGAQFRDIAGEGGSLFDLADLGPIDVAGSPFTVGAGTGGTFLNGSTLPIGEACCDSGANITWAPAQEGDPDNPGGFACCGDFLRTYDVGPGPDGIPGCIGDNSQASNGLSACDQRLGVTAAGPKSDGFYATGKDDVAINYTIGANTIPASNSRFQSRNAIPSVVTHFSGPPYNYVNPNPPTVNSVAAFPFRDILILIPKNTDIMVKVNNTFCPIVGNAPQCNQGIIDTDGDGVADSVDNCPTVANADQADGDGDLVGNVCDNCTTVANARVAANFLATNTWATLTGGQRDDDHDGYGNRCDARFPPNTTGLVGAADLTQFRASNGKSRTGDTCGTIGTRPCAIFDLDETGALIGSGDLARFRQLNGKVAGPKCTTCPLACEAGSTGTCN